MQQTDRGSYRTQETLAQQFYHSCLGKLVIAAGIIGVLLVIAHMTVPDEETMMAEMDDNIRQCIEANDSIKTDWIDDAINNVGYIFTTADSIPNQEIIDNFVKYNELKYYRHAFYATTLLHNNFKTDGIRVGIGIFGLVIPTVNFNDFLFKLGPMHKGYDQKPVKSSIIIQGDNWSTNPELGL
ncbi:MAG: hypothetical protein IJ533_00040 [Prevotella sp.]|nr:hypothetical protein [Prevotella sp.]